MALSFEQGAALGGALGGLGNFAADKLGYSSSAQARARNAKLLGLDNPQGRLADLATNQQTGEPIIGANNGGIAQLLNPTPAAQQQAPALDRSATPPAPPVPQNVAAPVAPPQPAQSSQSGGAFGSNVKTEDLIAVLRDPDSNEEDKAIAKSILSPRLSQGEAFTLGEGDRRYDAQGHLIASGGEKLDPDTRAYQQAIQDGFKGTRMEYDIAIKNAGRNNVSVNTAGETQFQKSLGEGQAKTINGLIDDGMNAKTDLANIDVLRRTMPANGGVLTGLQSVAQDWGVNVGPGADQLAVAKAVIAKLVPSQRAPGSGTTSDRDLALFQQALPRLTNTPAGNQLILETMQGLAEAKVARAQIAQDIANGTVTREDGFKALASLPDPMAAFKSKVGKAMTAKPVNPGATTINGYTIEPLN